MHTLNDDNKANVQGLIEAYRKISKDLNTVQAYRYKDALLTVIYYSGTEEQYYEFKNNY